MRWLLWSWLRLIVLALTWMLAGGCNYAEEVLDKQEPEVDPRQVFPNFALVSHGSTDLEGAADNTSLWGFPPCEGWPGGGDYRLQLGGLFTVPIPPEEGWARVESSRASILVHYPSGSSFPSAYLYAEKIDAEAPGADLRSFLQRVDRRFEQDVISNILKTPVSFTASGTGQASGAAGEERTTAPAESYEKNSMDSPTVSSDGELLVTAGASDTLDSVPVLGDGAIDGSAASVEPAPGTSPEGAAVEALETLETLRPGYTSEKGSFSGWKWLGTCAPPRPPSGVAAEVDPPLSTGVSTRGAMKPFLRLGRSVGEWRLQPGTEPIPAFQILATVTLPERRDYGVHLAIVCTAVPRCAESPTLSRLLGAIRVSPGAGLEGGGQDRRTLRELAAEVGILAPGVPDAEEGSRRDDMVLQTVPRSL